MSANILSGKVVRDSLLTGLVESVNKLYKRPRLAIVQVGNRPDSTTFIKAKKVFAQQIGIEIEHFSYKEDILESDLINEIQKMNGDERITGIIVQLPLPTSLNRENIINAIDSKKDADGLTARNVERLYNGSNQGIIPATARGIKELLDFYKIDLFEKNVVMVGRSSLVGRPVSQMCLNENATVTICHSKTVDLPEITKSANVLIVAIGKPNFIDSKYVREGQIVIDIGISKTDNGVCGDVNLESVKDIVKAITPVPGGVGPMTVLGLFQNVVDLSRASI